MHAVLLFSATLHIAAVGLVAAIALRTWLDVRRPKEPSLPETAMVAAALGLVTCAIATVLVWMGRGFGHALLTGMVAGLLAALAFILALGALPQARPSHGGPPSYAARMTAAAFVGVLILTELVAFSFLVTGAGSLART